MYFYSMRIRTDMRKYCQRNLEKKCDIYMIIIKIDCCDCSQMLCSLSIWMLSDVMWAKGLRHLMFQYLACQTMPENFLELQKFAQFMFF